MVVVLCSLLKNGGEKEMGLLDSLKNMKDQVVKGTSTPEPVKEAPAAAPVKSKAAPAPAPKDQIRSKFGDKMPYYDPEFGALEVSFNGFAEVKSESWAKDSKGSEFIASVITSTVKKSIMDLSNQKVSYKDLPRNITQIRQACNDVLKEKNIEPLSVSIATITLTPESKQKIQA